MHEAQKVLSNNGFRMANCFCCLSQNAMVCRAHCRQELNKILENCKTFSSRPRQRPRPNVQDQDQDFMIQDQDQDFHFCPRGASRPRPWSRGLHHCIIAVLVASARFWLMQPRHWRPPLSSPSFPAIHVLWSVSIQYTQVAFLCTPYRGINTWPRGCV